MISVIICHHRGNLVYNAVESLLGSQIVEFEIIVATSFQENELSLPGAKVLHINGGPAHKRNVAARFAKGEYLAFFDDDIEAKPLTLFYLKDTLEKKNAGMVFGKLLNMEFHDRFDEAGSFLTSSGFLYARAESGIKDNGQYDVSCPVLAGKSASCMIRRKVFWEIGGFDVSYEILGEETDLAWRVWLAGYLVFYSPQSVTFHAFNTRFKPKDFYIPRRVYFNGCRNYLTMLYTNLGKKRWIFPLVTQLIVWTVAGAGMFITGKLEAGRNIFKGIIYFFLNIKTIWQKRYHVQKKLRKVSDERLMPIITRNPPLSYYTKRFLHYIATGRHG